MHDLVFGSRLHCNVGISVTAASSELDIVCTSVATSVAIASEVLLFAATGLRIARRRLVGNLSTSWHSAVSDVLSGLLSSSYGFIDSAGSSNSGLAGHDIVSIDNVAAYSSVISLNSSIASSSACSFVRHCLRCSQISFYSVQACVASSESH